MVEWRVVPSYPWLEASADGQIRRRLKGINGRSIGRLIPGSINNVGYIATIVQRGSVRKTNVPFHVLVCEAFHGPRPSSAHQVAHNDGSRINNTANNLRWATAKENASDRSRHGTQSGSNHPFAKLLDDDLPIIHRLKHFGYRGSDIALMFDMNRNTINRALAGKLWARTAISAAANATLSFGA